MSIPILLQGWSHFEVEERELFVQTKACWIDLQAFADFQAHITTKTVSNGPTLGLQTSPVPDSDLFVTTWSATIASSETHSPVIRYDSASVLALAPLDTRGAAHGQRHGDLPDLDLGKPAGSRRVRRVLSLAMAVPFLLQSWIQIEVQQNRTTVQTEPYWLDLEDFRDLEVHASTALVTGGPVLALETAPAPEPDLFRVMWSQPLASSTQYLSLVRYDAASVPLSRWVRWTLSGRSTASRFATFRIWLSATRAAPWQVTAAFLRRNDLPEMEP